MKRGMRKEGSTKSLVPYLVGAPWPVVCVRRRPGTNESQLRPLGQIHQQASWSWSTPSSLDVSSSRNGGVPSWSPVVVGRGTPFQGPKLGSCLTLRKELSEETRADKASDFIGKDTRLESSR